MVKVTPSYGEKRRERHRGIFPLRRVPAIPTGTILLHLPRSTPSASSCLWQQAYPLSSASLSPWPPRPSIYPRVTPETLPQTWIFRSIPTPVAMNFTTPNHSRGSLGRISNPLPKSQDGIKLRQRVVAFSIIRASCASLTSTEPEVDHFDQASIQALQPL